MQLNDALVHVETGADAPDWRTAVRRSGEALVAGGVTTPEYTGAMVEAIERLGPYVVVAPGVALAHARPSPAVLRTGLAWIGLGRPVTFGHPTNDPVRLVVALAAVDHEAHLDAMAALAAGLGEPASRQRLLDAPGPEQVRALLAGGAPQPDTSSTAPTGRTPS